MGCHIRVMATNNSTILRRIWARLQGTSNGAEIRVGGCNTVDGTTDKQDVELFFTGALSLSRQGIKKKAIKGLRRFFSPVECNFQDLPPRGHT